jgi:hypothetical protein
MPAQYACGSHRTWPRHDWTTRLFLVPDRTAAVRCDESTVVITEGRLQIHERAFTVALRHYAVGFTSAG